ncbi:hypothetical protein [Escherichia albertii]|uniref:DUF11 domain-containing protein n=1 Tax=Escherichia albertii TaxID=208962 RepID=A0AAX3MUY3_ESCAL|nr:hypothetical protein [Escherichia albertii]WDB31962.1 hypothetical protein PS049_26165 [Escherichia albertii]WDB36819.1 hypothetical protein PS032_25970 [Escherichia albertii]HAW1374796.1 hypothetical protein [Escherichia coli]
MVPQLIATVNGYSHTRGTLISDHSTEQYYQIGGKLYPALYFRTTYLKFTKINNKPVHPEYENIWNLGTCNLVYGDGTITTYHNVGLLATPLIATGSPTTRHLVLQYKIPGASYSRPFISAKCTSKLDYTPYGGDKLEYTVNIRNSGYKDSGLNVTPTNFSVRADSDGNWKFGPISARVTNLSTVHVTVTGGDVILVGTSESAIRAGEKVEIYSIPDRYVDGYDTVSSGEFYLRGTARKFGKNTYNTS